MMRAREGLVTNLEQLDQDIQQKAGDLARLGGDIISTGEEMDIILALSHFDLTLGELRDYMDMRADAVEMILLGLMEKGIVEKRGTQYSLRGIDAS
jgi:ArsR family transcriptional regulator